ncbi:NAD(P)-binding protein [Mycena pura]|uniref:NAD(P)-binding protein n=1 Tax=Mycena pura TaxID=153505 RepID=A0AAD6UZK4_9AGAR|nr:NAD(P)-binding protein [Mycena pura]
MSFNDSDKRVWLVTGASSGLGLALVNAVLAAGERVIATLRKPENLKDLEAKYPREQLLVQRLDVTNLAEIKTVFDAARTHFGRLDVVVNNAGYGILAEIEATPDEAARHNFEVQFWGPVNITREAIKFLRDVNPKGHGGLVINISSVGGYLANAGISFYNASKFALEGFTQAFVREMPPEWNIRGLIVEPGGFASEWAQGSMQTFPAPPEYGPTSPSVVMRATLDPSKNDPLGLPERMAAAIMRVADVKGPLPLRLPLGSEAWAIVRGQAQRTLHETDEWAEVSHSTNRDGIDGPAFAKGIMETLKSLS